MKLPANHLNQPAARRGMRKRAGDGWGKEREVKPARAAL